MNQPLEITAYLLLSVVALAVLGLAADWLGRDKP